MMMASISVIIPTLDDPLLVQVIQAAATALAEVAAVIDRWEIIVVGRHPQLAALKQQLALGEALRIIETVQPVRPGRARNLGMAAANGDWFFLLDADCVVRPHWAQQFVAHLQTGKQVVGGGILCGGTGFWALAYNLSFFHEFLASQAPGYKRYLPTLNLALRRTVYEQVGDLDEQLPRAEDLQWTIRMALAGYTLYFEPQAAVTHHSRCSSRAAFWQTWRISGYYSRRNRLAFSAYYQTPGLLAYPGLVGLLAPVIALGVTGKVWLKTREVRRHLHVVPAIYLGRVAWCLGASQLSAE
ncbi:MAG: glycosyltransferase [Caldilineaceae bacterium]